MKVFGIFLVACLTLARGDHESENKECPNLTEEVLAKLKAQLVTEDIHDQLVGEHSEVWGGKHFLEEDPEACVKTVRTKFDDIFLNQTVHYKNKHFADGEKSNNGTLEKLDNGIYVIRKSSGEPFGKMFFLYAKDDVLAYYICTYSSHKSGENIDDMKKWKHPYFSSVLVNTKDAKNDLDEAVKKNVDEAVKKIQSDPELFGEIQQHTNFC